MTHNGTYHWSVLDNLHEDPKSSKEVLKLHRVTCRLGRYGTPRTGVSITREGIKQHGRACANTVPARNLRVLTRVNIL